MKTKYKNKDILDTESIYLDTIYPVGAQVTLYNDSFDPNVSWVGKWVEVPNVDSEGNYLKETFIDRRNIEQLLTNGDGQQDGNISDVVVSRFYFGRKSGEAGVDRYLTKRITNLGTELEFLVRESTTKKEAGVIITSGADNIRNVRYIANYQCNTDTANESEYLMGLNSTTAYIFKGGFPSFSSTSAAATRGELTNQWPAASGPLTFLGKSYYYVPITTPTNTSPVGQTSSYVVEWQRRQGSSGIMNSWWGTGKFFMTHTSSRNQTIQTENAFDIAFIANTPGAGWVPGFQKYIKSSDSSVTITSWYNIIEVYERLDKNHKVKVWKRIY